MFRENVLFCVVTNDLTGKISLSVKSDRKMKFQGNKISCNAIRDFYKKKKKLLERNTLISSEQDSHLRIFQYFLSLSLSFLSFFFFFS